MYQNKRFQAAVESLADRDKGTAREAALAALAMVAGSPAPGRVVGCLLCDISNEDSVRELFGADLLPLMMVPPPDWEEAVTLLPIEERGGYNGNGNDDDNGAWRSVWPSSYAPPPLLHTKTQHTPVCVPSLSAGHSSHTKTS